MAGTLRAVSRINIRNVVFLIKHRWKTYSTAAEEARSIPQLAKLTDKSILRITGRDSAKFMQGVITHDICKLKPDGQRSLFAMLLNSQGRILFDAFIYCVPGEIDEYFLECDKSAVDDIIKHLKTYKLRSKVNFEDASKDVEPWVLFGENDCTGIEMISNENILATKDPRLGHLCIRMIVPWNQSPVDFTRIDEHVVVDAAVYKEHRYKCGIPEGINEISSTKSLPLEYNLALMNGGMYFNISFVKRMVITYSHFYFDGYHICDTLLNRIGLYRHTYKDFPLDLVRTNVL